MRHLVYSVRYSVVPINSSLLTITLYSSVITTLVYNDTKYSGPSWRYNRVWLYRNKETVVSRKRPFCQGDGQCELRSEWQMCCVSCSPYPWAYQPLLLYKGLGYTDGDHRSWPHFESCFSPSAFITESKRFGAHLLVQSQLFAKYHTENEKAG
jgi:hypothetical protein